VSSKPRLAMLVVAHPDGQSFSHAMAHRAREVLRSSRYALADHDLYAENFDPVRQTGETIDGSAGDALVEQHCAELQQASLILIFHPNWWGQPPAILKGWIDRVFRLGVAYEYPSSATLADAPIGTLRASEALIFNTSNTAPEREARVFGDPLELLWRRCVFGLCGVREVTRRMYAPVFGSSAAQRDAWLAEVARLVERAASASPGAR